MIERREKNPIFFISSFIIMSHFIFLKVPTMSLNWYFQTIKNLFFIRYANISKWDLNFGDSMVFPEKTQSLRMGVKLIQTFRDSLGTERPQFWRSYGIHPQTPQIFGIDTKIVSSFHSSEKKKTFCNLRRKYSKKKKEKHMLWFLY